MPSERRYISKILLGLLVVAVVSAACPAGKYTFGATCAACSSGCSVCSSNTTCSTCYSSYYLSSNFCYSCSANCRVCSTILSCSSCNSGYYVNLGSCSACASGCGTCTGPFASNCISCSPGYSTDSSGNCNLDPTVTNSFPVGAAIGISIGGVLLYFCIVLGIICCLRRKRPANLLQGQPGVANQSATLAMGPTGPSRFQAPMYDPYNQGGLQTNPALPPNFVQPQSYPYQPAQPSYSNPYQNPPGIFQEGGPSQMQPPIFS